MVNKDQIKAWKEKYGKDNILKTLIKDKEVYLVTPEALDNYFHLAKRSLNLYHGGDIFGAGELIFNSCYLGGLGELKSMDQNDPIYVNMCANCVNLVELTGVNFMPV